MVLTRSARKAGSGRRIANQDQMEVEETHRRLSFSAAADSAVSAHTNTNTNVNTSLVNTSPVSDQLGLAAADRALAAAEALRRATPRVSRTAATSSAATASSVSTVNLSARERSLVRDAAPTRRSVVSPVRRSSHAPSASAPAHTLGKTVMRSFTWLPQAAFTVVVATAAFCDVWLMWAARQRRTLFLAAAAVALVVAALVATTPPFAFGRMTTEVPSGEASGQISEVALLNLLLRNRRQLDELSFALGTSAALEAARNAQESTVHLSATVKLARDEIQALQTSINSIFGDEKQDRELAARTARSLDLLTKRVDAIAAAAAGFVDTAQLSGIQAQISEVSDTAVPQLKARISELESRPTISITDQGDASSDAIASAAQAAADAQRSASSTASDVATLSQQLNEYRDEQQREAAELSRLDDLLRAATLSMAGLAADVRRHDNDLQDHSHRSIEERLLELEQLQGRVEALRSVQSRLVALEQLAASPAPASVQEREEVDWERVDRIARNAVDDFAADRIARIDWALGTLGGKVLSASPSYSEGSFFSQRVGGGPQALIDPSVMPGQCYSMRGSSGGVVVKLARPILPEQFSLEHLDHRLAEDFWTHAPQRWRVWGLPRCDGQDPSRVPLWAGATVDPSTGKILLEGESFWYNVTRPGSEPYPVIQTVAAINTNAAVFPCVGLEILSNWGSTDYTAIYRFRVHGKRI